MDSVYQYDHLFGIEGAGGCLSFSGLTLPLGVIGRLCSVIVALPGLVYIIYLLLRCYFTQYFVSNPALPFSP